MDRRLVITLLSLIIIGVGIGIGFIIKNNYHKLSSNEVDIVLQTNGGVPYTWEYEIKDQEVLELVKQYDEVEEKYKNRNGAPVKVHFVFKGKKQGSTTVVFKYRNITDNTIEKEIKRKISVDEYGKIINDK